MTDKSLITVLTAAHDKRQRVVKPTQHGEALQHQASTIPEQVFCQFNKLDANQAQQLMQLLDLVVNDSAN